jgi:crossover junction endodeoxyribonuclease RuvC
MAEVTYEGYGPGGVAILLQALTDNRNRTVSDVRSTLTKTGGNLANTGAVTWQFEQKGVVVAETEDADELALVAIDAGADDFEAVNGTLLTYSAPGQLEDIRTALSEHGAAIKSSELSMVPTNTITLDERAAKQTLRLLDQLEELGDIQRVFSNADFPDEVLEEYGKEAYKGDTAKAARPSRRVPLRILGVDPGTFAMGIGVVDAEGPDLIHVYSHVLAPPKRDTRADRLYFLFSGLVEVIGEWRPAEVAIEEPFAASNIKAALAIGQAQAVAMVAAARHGLAVSTYAPRQVKRAVTDYGGSSKEQVQSMVQALLGLDGTALPSDAADALAVAICHINSTRVDDLVITE